MPELDLKLSYAVRESEKATAIVKLISEEGEEDKNMSDKQKTQK